MNICDLMRIRDDRRGSSGNYRPGEFRWRHQARFDVDMSIDEARQDETAVDIHDRFGVVSWAQTRNEGPGHRHILFYDLPREDVHHPSAPEEEVGPDVTTGHGEKPLFIHGSRIWS